MAKFKNVRVSYENSATVNTGNFQNVRPGYIVSADVEEGVHPKEAREALKALVDTWLEEDVNQIQEELNS
jgi:hypothetical protein